MDDDLPDWVEWSIRKVAFLLSFGGGGAMIPAVVLVCLMATGNGGPDSPVIPAVVFGGGLVALVIGIGMYAEQMWAFVLALIPCLGGAVLIGGIVLSGDLDAKDLKLILVGMILAVASLAIIYVLGLRLFRRARD